MHILYIQLKHNDEQQWFILDACLIVDVMNSFIWIINDKSFLHSESFGCMSGVKEMGASDSELEHLSLDINMKDCTSKKISLGSSVFGPFFVS